MFKEYIMEMGGYTLYGELSVFPENPEEKCMVVTRYKGGGSKLFVPDSFIIENQKVPVYAIEKKAFLGIVSLQQVSLPGGIKRIEDWAFAQCPNLKKIIIRPDSLCKKLSVSEIMNQLFIGTGVFEGCMKISDICIGREESDDLSALLAAVIYRLEAEHLLRDRSIGEISWYEKWDQRLSSFLQEKDSSGYTDLVLCGEEDLNSSKSAFVKEKRMRKSILCLLRLKYHENLSEDSRKKYVNYLVSHTKGETSDEAWQALLEEFGQNTDYFKLFAEIGAINKENIDYMLEDMGASLAEAKAFLLGYKQDNFGDSSVFDLFTL